MSSWTITDTTGIRWFTVTPARLLTRGLILVPAVIAVVAQQFAAPSAQMWPALLIVPLAAYAARSPDSVAAAFFITAYAVWWLVTDTDEATPWSLVAALCVLVFHSAVAVASAGPQGLVPDRGTVSRWLRDTGLVALTTWGVWLMVAGFHGTTQSSEVLVGLSLVLVAGLVVLATGPTTPPPVGPPTGGVQEPGRGYRYGRSSGTSGN